MTAEINQLPDLSDYYEVTPEQIAKYQRDGHIVLRGVLKPHEVKAYRPILSATLFEHNDEHRPLEERNTHDKAFLQVWNLWERNKLVHPFVLSKRFAKIAADLTGVDAIRLYHDQALYKEPGGGYTPWHQDQYYWPLATDYSITMWMPLVDVSIEMGALTFASGSHKDGFFGHLEISDEGHTVLDQRVRDKGYPIVSDALAAGDCTFHSGWCLHMAPANETDRMREVMTVIYYDDGAKIGEADNPGRQWDLDRWFPGQKPGDIAGTHLNPLLYKKGS